LPDSFNSLNDKNENTNLEVTDAAKDLIDIINFNPPKTDDKRPELMPHIRLDRALNMLIGDKLK